MNAPSAIDLLAVLQSMIPVLDMSIVLNICSS